MLALEQDAEVVEEFFRGLQAAIDASDADLFNRAFTIVPSGDRAVDDMAF